MCKDDDRKVVESGSFNPKLQESDRHLREILSLMRDGIVIVDRLGLIQFVNKPAEDLFQRKGEALVGERFPFPLDERETAVEILQKGGEQICVEIRGALFEWKEGELFWLATLRNVTERRRTEKELRKLHLAVAESPSMVMITDAQGNIEFVNPKFTKTTGYSRAEAVGRNPRMLQSGKVSPEVYKDLWETITAGREWHGEFINKKKNGDIYHESASIAPVMGFDGEITHFVAVKEDVTERKHAEMALRESEALLKVIFDQASQFMGLMKPDGTLLKMNRSAADLIKTEESEILGRPFWDTPWWSHSAEQRERLQEAVKTAAKGEFVRFETTHPTSDGKIVWVDFSMKPVRDNEGRVIYLLPEGRDISQQKEANERIEILNTELAFRNVELESANHELEAFSYSVSHDLRTPLAVISGYIPLVQEMCGDNLNDQCRQFFQEIFKGTVRMNQLIDALLDFSRAGRTPLRWETVDLSEIAMDISAELAQTAPERKTTFTVAEGIEAEGDAGLLRVVLSNILGNAWKYTSRQEEAVIEFGVAEREGDTAFFVRDNGPGFDMSEAASLFVPFHRLDRNRDFGGHGIGLATVERIISRHCGRIWAEGEVGRGATFYFTLPAKKLQDTKWAPHQGG